VFEDFSALDYSCDIVEAVRRETNKRWVWLARLLPLALLCLTAGPVVVALQTPANTLDTQEQTDSSTPAKTDVSAAAEPLLTMFPHADWSRVFISGQANFISQWHPAFHSPYQGANSLSPQAQDASSRVLTLLTGLRLTSTTEFLCDVQETGGHGVGEALGVAGFFNLDVVRNPSLGKAPYIARLMWHQVIPLGKEKAKGERGESGLLRGLTERRLELRFGKMSLPDFFDVNTYGSDSNLQFMNWTVDNNGAYDYAADTRGYTFAAMLEYHQSDMAVRFAEALMPKVANGINLDGDLGRARSENVEFEYHRKVWREQESVVRLLAFVNHANMGDYDAAVDNFLAGLTRVPEITAHPLQTTIKYGFGVNIEQPITDWIGVFARWGWNEGQHESYAYTEADQTWQVGAGGNGGKWGRKNDRLGLAFVSNGISHPHQQYLADGGLGFLLGDGRLRYGRETIVETYYTLHVWRGIFPSFDFQYMANPGYNRDRGPVVVPSLRLHVDF